MFHEDNEKQNPTVNRMLNVVHKECVKKIYVTKTDIIEHKDDLVRKYLDKKEIVNVEQKDK